MKLRPTGIIRRIDDLRRLTIPPAVCKALSIYSGDPLEFYVDKDCIIIKKYIPEDERN